MAAQIFQKGDVVRLKSGGPDMTVEEYDDEFDLCACIWFEGAKQHHRPFPAHVLEKVTK